MRRLGILCVLVAAGVAHADIQYVFQHREVKVRTSFDNGLESDAAPAFDPFNRTLNRLVSVPTSTGPRTIQGTSGISCTLDLQFVQAAGTLRGAGAVNLQGGQETGSGEVNVEAIFNLLEPTPYLLFASRIDAMGTRGLGGDNYLLTFERLSGTPQVLFESSPNGPYINSVNMTGVLEPGQYRIFYEAEVEGLGDLREGAYDVAFYIPAPTPLAALALPLLARRRRGV